MSDAPLHYELSAANGPVVVLLHGLFGDLDNLKNLGRSLETEYQVLYVDLPNHGDSPHQAEMSLASMATALAQLCQQLSLPQIFVVGHSLGGKVAMELALSQPQLVRAVVAADIAPVAYEARHNNILAALNSVDLASIQQRQDADRALARSIDSLGVRQFLLKNLRRDGQQWHWRLNLTALIDNYPALTGAVREGHYDGPILFIKGGASDYLLAAHESAIRARFSQPEMKIIEGAGHWLHAEKPAVFNRLVQAFLAQHRSTTLSA